jgi:hypothetical protein
VQNFESPHNLAWTFPKSIGSSIITKKCSVRDCVRLIIVAVRDGVSLFRADMHHWLRKRVERELPIPKEVDEYRRMVSSGDGLPMLRLRWSRLGLCADDGRPHWHKPQADAKEPGSCAQCARHVQITTWLSTFTLAPGTEAGFGYKKPKKNTHTFFRSACWVPQRPQEPGVSKLGNPGARSRD